MASPSTTVFKDNIIAANKAAVPTKVKEAAKFDLSDFHWYVENYFRFEFATTS